MPPIAELEFRVKNFYVKIARMVRFYIHKWGPKFEFRVKLHFHVTHVWPITIDLKSILWNKNFGGVSASYRRGMAADLDFGRVFKYISFLFSFNWFIYEIININCN